MHDDHLQDSLSRMLHTRAAALPGQTDPVGATREGLAAARRRRRVAMSATAVLVVAGGAAAGGQAFGHVSSASKASAASGSALVSTTRPAAPDLEHAPIPPSVTPTYSATCGTAEKIMFSDATEYPDAARGALAGDSALTGPLLARAAGLVDGTDARVVYAGEDAATRIVVVFVNPHASTGWCGKGMQAVVFHGPAGTAAADLQAQVSRDGVVFGPNFGFTWGERNADGSMTTLVVNPSAATTLTPAGDLLGNITGVWSTLDTPDGTYLHTYAVGAPVPQMYDFPSPNDKDTADTQSFVVTAATKQAYADAAGTTPGHVVSADNGYTGDVSATAVLPAYGVQPGSFQELVRLTQLPGTEHVYWTDFVGG
jgi:hypothetical protein